MQPNSCSAICSMTICYQLITSLLAILLFPVLLPVLVRKKYRLRLLKRCGFRLARQLPACPPYSVPQKTIWIHALSVGEVTSAVPLVRGLATEMAAVRLIFSTATRSGEEVARRLLAGMATVITGPLDLGPVVPHYLRLIKPDLFVLVETDFWPHWLACVARKNIPLMLVNGRISAPSLAIYQRFSLLFGPMFARFTLLSMQTKADAATIQALGVPAAKVQTLGNLKFDAVLGMNSNQGMPAPSLSPATLGLDPQAPLWICGSTHRGEEEMLLETFCQIRSQVPDLLLLIAPRNIDRAAEISALALSFGLDGRLRSTGSGSQSPLLILDTLGELAGCYTLATVAFIGGSLVAQGGHNPIEPASCGVPVLFGPHMDDFSEIAADLIQAGGACQVTTSSDLADVLLPLLNDSTVRSAMATKALTCVKAQSGVLRSHLAIIRSLLRHPIIPPEEDEEAVD